MSFSDTPRTPLPVLRHYSLVETAKANGQDLYVCLRHIRERLHHTKAVEDYDALLPWNCTPALPR